jgi:alginate O-acetyltransferase complex protein AlgJ
VVPSKARVHPEHLGRYVLPAQIDARYDRFLEGLASRGVAAVGLLESLLEAAAAGPVFLRTDTHWNASGSAAAAAALATRIRAEGLLKAIDTATVTYQVGEPSPYEGDLLSFLPLGRFQDTLGPAWDTVAPVTGEVAASGGLFDVAVIPVAVVGTSYSHETALGFVPSLRQQLGADVLNASQEGLGPFVAMADYLADGAFLDSPPELVIWEIPERYLPLPIAPDE